MVRNGTFRAFYEISLKTLLKSLAFILVSADAIGYSNYISVFVSIFLVGLLAGLIPFLMFSSCLMA